MTPADDFDRQLLDHVRPSDWVNPSPASRYNLVVIGAGTAGLIAASGAAGLGARVALVERYQMGGDCLNVGCVPSKALLRAARAAAAVRDSANFGVLVPTPIPVDFAVAMQRLRRLRSQISPNDSAQRYRGLGVDVFFGQAQFIAPDAIQVEQQQLRFTKAVIATGARAAVPPIPGLVDAGFLTNETVFSLGELPRRMAVIGAGPIGCELAQAFARFGSQVYLIEARHGILPNDEPDAAETVRQALLRDGIRFLCCGKSLQVQPAAGGKRLTLDSHERHYEIEVDQILVGTGRAANVEGMGLEAAQVAYDRSGVTVNDRLQTSNPRIFAAGDVCSRYKFTHAADAMARLVLQNALFFGRAKASALTIPWCTYTDPEVAHVGLDPRQAEQRSIAIETFEQRLAHVDRAILDGDTDGFARVHVAAGTDRILGATIVARHAGELISELTLAMVGRLGLRSIARTIHPYPTQSEVIKRIADAYNRTRLTPSVRSLLQRWFAWTR